jgi:hypothetical protein
MIYYIIDSNMYLFGDTKIPTSTKPDFRFALNSKEKCS